MHTTMLRPVLVLASFAAAALAAAPAPASDRPASAADPAVERTIPHRPVTPAVLEGPMDERGRRPHDVGPPPPGHWRIIGDVVPGWTPARIGRPWATGARAADYLGEVAGTGGPAVPSWFSIGPQPILSEYWSGNDDASGRVVSIAPHPTDPDTAYIASASGGVWKTTNGGLHWMPLTDELPTLNHGAVAIDPGAPETVYVGTGEYTTASTGDGVFVSRDGGASWERFATAAETGTRCSALLVDPTNSKVVHYAGDRYARTTDGGATWTTGLAGAMSDLVLDPVNPQRLLVARHGDGVFRSLNGGQSWTRASTGLPTGGIGRIVLAIAASEPDVVYAAIADGGTTIGTWKTTDFGDTWNELESAPAFASPQSWYDMYLAVDPTDADRVFAGGVSPIYAVAGILRSTDGGATWTEISAGTTPFSNQTHPDHHDLAFGPGGRIWEANDGGVWRSDDGGDTWVNRAGWLAITQLYAVGVSPHDDVLVLGGTQDNGTIERVADELAWPQLIAGDGGFLAYDHETPGIKYTTYVYLTVQRWIDGAYSNITGPWQDDPRNFIAPLVMSPSDGGTLYGGTNRLWRTTSAPGLADWTAISTDEIGGGTPLNAIAVAPSDEQVIYTGSNNGRLWTKDAEGWTDRSAGLPSSRIVDLVVDPSDAATAYVAYRRTSGPRLFRTEDLGATWTDASGALPDGFGVTALAVDWDRDTPHLFVGTGAGVWWSPDAGETWVKDGADLPNVNIGDLVVDVDRGLVIAGTYGRGAWMSFLPGDCGADVDRDGSVGIADLLAVLSNWGPCGDCPADVDHSGAVDEADLLLVVAAWGDC